MVYQISLNTGVVDYDFPHLLRSLTAVGVFRPVNDPLLYVTLALPCSSSVPLVNLTALRAFNLILSTTSPHACTRHSLLFR